MEKGNRNIIFIDKDGKVVIASATGELAVMKSATLLPGDVIALMKKRQAIGKELTQALTKANYPVRGAVHSDVIDPSRALAKVSEKKKKR
jgi:hypothetical protein